MQHRLMLKKQKYSKANLELLDRDGSKLGFTSIWPDIRQSEPPILFAIYDNYLINAVLCSPLVSSHSIVTSVLLRISHASLTVINLGELIVLLEVLVETSELSGIAPDLVSEFHVYFPRVSGIYPIGHLAFVKLGFTVTVFKFLVPL